MAFSCFTHIIINVEEVNCVKELFSARFACYVESINIVNTACFKLLGSSLCEQSIFFFSKEMSDLMSNFFNI